MALLSDGLVLSFHSLSDDSTHDTLLVSHDYYDRNEGTAQERPQKKRYNRRQRFFSSFDRQTMERKELTIHSERRIERAKRISVFLGFLLTDWVKMRNLRSRSVEERSDVFSSATLWVSFLFRLLLVAIWTWNVTSSNDTLITRDSFPRHYSRLETGGHLSVCALLVVVCEKEIFNCAPQKEPALL